MHIWSLLWHQIAQCFVLLAWSGAWRGVRASATNATIDDADPRIQYSDGWNVGGHCDMCAAVIPEEERTNAYDATWRDATSREGSVHFRVIFTGSACYVYGILRNGNETAISYTTQTNLTFIVDDKVVGYFQHKPRGDDRWLFNQLVFSKDDMNEELHNLTVRLEPKSLFLFDYLKITSMQSDPLSMPASNDNTKIATIAGVIGAMVLIGLILFWFFYRRRKRGVQVIEPHNPLLLADYPGGSGSPAGHISPFYGAPPYKKIRKTGYDGDHEENVLLVGAPATGDRKNKNKYSLYNAPEVSVSSQTLQEPLVTSTPASSREPSPPPTMATYATSSHSGIKESVRGGITSNYTEGASEGKGFQSAPFVQTATATLPRPPRLTIPSSSTSQPVLPNLRQTSLYPSAIAAADLSQMKMREQRPQTTPPMSPQPMTAITMPPPYRSPTHASPIP